MLSSRPCGDSVRSGGITPALCTTAWRSGTSAAKPVAKRRTSSRSATSQRHSRSSAPGCVGADPVGDPGPLGLVAHEHVHDRAEVGQPLDRRDPEPGAGAGDEDVPTLQRPRQAGRPASPAAPAARRARSSCSRGPASGPWPCRPRGRAAGGASGPVLGSARVETRQLVGGQLDLGCGGGVGDRRGPLGAGDRDDDRRLGELPGERDLLGADAAVAWRSRRRRGACRRAPWRRTGRRAGSTAGTPGRAPRTRRSRAGSSGTSG